MLAAVLRLGWPGLTEFKADEARLLTLALDMAELRTFPTRGIASSVGFPNSPVSVWLYALPLFVWRHVYAATLYTGFLNVLAVLGCWWIARRYWGPYAGLAAALLIAVNPWAIAHARKIWAQNLLPPLVTGWAITGLLAYVERRRWFLALHLLFLALAVLVHFAGLALLLPTLFALLLFRRAVHWPALLAGAGLAFAVAVPFLYDLLNQSRSGATALPGGLATPGAERFVQSWRYSFLLATGREIHSLAGPEQFQAYLASLPDLSAVHLIIAALVLAGGVVLVRGWRSPETSAGAGQFLLLWLLLPPLVIAVLPAQPQLHYLLVLYPALFVAAGIGFDWLLGLLKGIRPLAWVVLLLIAALQLWAWGSLLSLVGHVETPGGFGTPLANTLAVADTARSLLTERGLGEILIGSSGEDPLEDELAAVYGALLRDVPHRPVNVLNSALFPAAGAVVILPDGSSGAAPVYRAVGESLATLPLREGGGNVALLATGAPPEPRYRPDAPVLFANWITLQGYAVKTDSATDELTWRLYWSTPDSPQPADYHFFNQLLDESGAQIAQADAPTFAAGLWRAGDSVVSHFSLPLPPGAAPTTMRTGLYRFPGLEAVPYLDVAANPAGDFVFLPLAATD